MFICVTPVTWSYAGTRQIAREIGRNSGYTWGQYAVIVANEYDAEAEAEAIAETQARLRFGSYYTILIPWSDTPTEWHPTEKTGPFAVLSRGAFWRETDAHAWAAEHLGGQPYTLRRVIW